jgi:hypothetical protein
MIEKSLELQSMDRVEGNQKGVLKHSDKQLATVTTNWQW